MNHQYFTGVEGDWGGWCSVTTFQRAVEAASASSSHLSCALSSRRSPTLVCDVRSVFESRTNTSTRGWALSSVLTE
jgi:hypothetical protein